MRATNNEEGQALVIVVLAMGIFLLGAVGLGFDGSQLYSERTRAQLAADAAAQAAMISIFNGTNTFSTSAFTCTTTGTQTPCVYARNNGFGGTAADTVTIDYPADSAAPGVNFTSDPIHLVRATVSRDVPTTLMRLLGPTTTTVKAVGIAAIVNVITPVPIVVTHPTAAQSLYLNGTGATIKICGGPTKSIQVNSSNSAAFYNGNGAVDLSHAGPPDTGGCTSTAGNADFGVYGGPTSNPNPGTAVNFGTGGTGKYVSGAFPLDDPFANVSSPPAPANTGSMGTSRTISSGTDGCAYANCTEYYPGSWSSLNFSGQNIILRPGLYYVTGGGVQFQGTNGGQGPTPASGDPAYSARCPTSSCGADPDTGNGVTIYDTSTSPSSTATQGFNMATGVNLTMHGATKTTTNSLGETVPAGPYYGMLFWEDRNADAHTGNGATKNGGGHNIGSGSGCFTLIGNIYMTNTKATMTADPAHYQAATYSGTPCSTTTQQGYIIVSTLQIKGTSNLSMTIPPYGYVTTRKIALVQ